LAVPGSFRKKHYLLGFKKFIENPAGPHIPLPADREGTPRTVYPALKRLNEKLFLGRSPNHLERESANNSPREEDRVVRRDMIGREKDASGSRDTLIAGDCEAVQYGSIDADDMCGERDPKTAEKRYLQTNLVRFEIRTKVIYSIFKRVGQPL